MKATMKVTGYKSTRLMLRNIAKRVPDKSRKQMRRSADRIVKRARLYVPEDTEALKNSIRIERSYGERGRLQIDIVVGDMTVVNKYGKTINLNQYATIIHENYGSMNPGRRTIEKQFANPNIQIGEQFMTRAADDEEAAMRRSIIQAITSVIAEEQR